MRICPYNDMRWPAGEQTSVSLFPSLHGYNSSTRSNDLCMTRSHIHVHKPFTITAMGSILREPMFHGFHLDYTVVHL